MKIVFSDKSNEYLKSRLSKLPLTKQVVFGLVCCERMFPIFIKFSKDTSWKTPDAVRHFIDLLWDYAEDPEGTLITEEELDEAIELVPDTDDEDLYDSDEDDLLDEACEAAGVVALLMKSIVERSDITKTLTVIVNNKLVECLCCYVEIFLEDSDDETFPYMDENFEQTLEVALQNPLCGFEVVSDEVKDKRRDESEFVRNVLCCPLIQRELRLLLDILDDIETCDDIGILRKKYGNCTDGCLCYQDAKSGKIKIHPFWK